MPFGQIAGQPIPFIARLSPFYLQAVFPVIRRLSQPRKQLEVCAVTSRQGKGREAVPNRRQPGSCRSMPELRPVETTRYSTARPVFMPLVSDFPPPVPYLSLVTCHVKGKQRYFLSAPRFHSARSKFRRGADKENPVRVCPGRPLLDPPKPHSFLFHFLLHLYPARPYPPFTIIFTGLFRFPLRHRRPVFQLQRSAAALDPAA